MKIKFSIFSFLFLGAVFLGLVQCQKANDEMSPEQKLLNLFKLELRLVEAYKENYVAYMVYQVNNFGKKNRLMSESIEAINDKFSKMTTDERREYQFAWQSKFQPIIDKIYEATRKMILTQTKNLDQKNMARIQELTIKMEILEKEVPSAKLKPQFFIVQQ